MVNFAVLSLNYTHFVCFRCLNVTFFSVFWFFSRYTYKQLERKDKNSKDRKRWTVRARESKIPEAIYLIFFLHSNTCVNPAKNTLKVQVFAKYITSPNAIDGGGGGSGKRQTLLCQTIVYDDKFSRSPLMLLFEIIQEMNN